MQSSILSAFSGRAGGRVSVSMGPWQVWHLTFATATWTRWEKKTWGGSRQTRCQGISRPFSPNAWSFCSSALLAWAPE